MAELLKRKAKGLRKAADATHDPADIPTTSTPTSENTNPPASENTSKTASTPTSENAGNPASKTTSKTAGEKTTRRRRGRPQGPDRIPTTVRILTDLNQALTHACHTTGLGPQDITEAALTEWLIRHGHLTKNASKDAQDLLKRVRRHTIPPSNVAGA